MSHRLLLWRRLKNQVFFTLLVFMSLIALFPLFNILWYVISRGLPELSIRFFTRLPGPVGMVGGMANAIVGTLIVVSLACLIAIPIGVGAGIYMAEYADDRFAAVCRFLADVLSGVPSIVAGLMVYATVVIWMHSYSAFAGALSLALLMLPTLMRTTEQMLLMVDTSLREGAFALGATRFQTTVQVVLPTAASGLITAVMLSIGRVMGETAPLLFTAFGNSFWQDGLNAPIAALPLQVFVYATSPYPQWQAQAWTGALTLLAIILVINIAARAFGRGKLR